MTSRKQEQQSEKKLAYRIYYWLFFSPLLTGSCYLVMESFNRAASGRLAWTAFIPLLFQAPLLFGFVQESLYVRRHAQQAVGLAVLRAVTAWFSLMVGTNPGDAVAVWFILNGSIWFFGGTWGLNQVSHGECWLMHRMDPDEELPRPWAVKEQARLHDAEVEQAEMHEATSDPETSYYRGMDLIVGGAPDLARKAFLRSFRSTDDPALREKIIVKLEQLGEVEKF